MNANEARNLPASREVVGWMGGMWRDGVGAVIKLKLRSGAVETAFLCSTHLLMCLDAFELWTSRNPNLDCGNGTASDEVRRLPVPIIDNAPALVPNDWDESDKMASPFVHIFDNAVVLVLTFGSGRERGHILTPGGIWVIRSVLVPERHRLIDLRDNPAGPRQ